MTELCSVCKETAEVKLEDGDCFCRYCGWTDASESGRDWMLYLPIGADEDDPDYDACMFCAVCDFCGGSLGFDEMEDWLKGGWKGKVAICDGCPSCTECGEEVFAGLTADQIRELFKDKANEPELVCKDCKDSH